MNKCLILILFTFISTLVNAQTDEKYMKGAVPEEDGRVVFSKTVETSLPAADVYQKMNDWASQNYTQTEANPKQRILFNSPEQRSIACQGEKELVFNKSVFNMDKTTMNYQLIITATDRQCKIAIRNISYDYFDTKTNPIVLKAEETITDKVALRGNKSIYKAYKGFRTHTIDFVNDLYAEISGYLNSSEKENSTSDILPKASTEISVVPAEGVVSTEMPGFRKIDADKIPGNYVKLLNEWTLITSGTKDETNVMTASWGGLGVFWGKPVAFCFLNPTRYSIKTMDAGDVYTISFYTETYKTNMEYCGQVSGRNVDKIKGSGLTPIKTPSGASAFAEAWLILECKKLIAQPIQPDAVVDKEASGKWAKDGYHKMYVGEILNVWVK
ncbi:flavin reductase (DIM6/NTAB) family NADH-FMN oxidoreductase RutF [Dysgonomonas sp. PH5-45]|uniref:DUF4468 domain-containing protein n=1 Tax=unclassified Dysgonomonas TaxID=2630389 RepID=UPI00247482A5|nr:MULTISPECIES: DUF4468 domain-containing protein [unclassified Dysgonomonas]MDH6354636.1 flavin reductase (DIM6/NTAB) family NADH-FMN oxidoreductase RutF [Dysgonomonas sp. PH5-45]MDH6387534.1 flavin reductase (DIM6/NTAB) family NADH-FMN oxidoreductase RutF [Dysgonomonas sp. PH5-37]